MKTIKLSERTRKPSPNEKKFEKMLIASGFEITGIKEYSDRSEYRIKKDDVEMDNVTLWDSNRIKVKECFEFTLKSFEQQKQLKLLLSK
jgi:hypothetical protein